LADLGLGQQRRMGGILLKHCLSRSDAIGLRSGAPVSSYFESELKPGGPDTR
jgi:hypothetical protein